MDNLSNPLQQGKEFEQKMKEIEKETEYLNEVRLEDYLEEENIEVEEIQIGAETK